jgi:hypothetical protein
MRKRGELKENIYWHVAIAFSLVVARMAEDNDMPKQLKGS